VKKKKKGELPPNTLENLSRRFWQMYWAEDTDISTRPIVEEACAFVGISHEQTQKILEEANSANIKDLLKGTTEEAVAKGSFGAPTIIVKCSNLPKEEFFFWIRPLSYPISNDRIAVEWSSKSCF